MSWRTDGCYWAFVIVVGVPLWFIGLSLTLRMRSIPAQIATMVGYAVCHLLLCFLSAELFIRRRGQGNDINSNTKD